jgi:hypothetical protein
MPSRFVILHHQVAGGEHWDLMLERGEILLTWQLPREPVERSSLPMPAKRIFDHRKAYLTCEGPVSGDRGSVARVDAGTVEIKEAAPDRYLVLLDGERLAGWFALTVEGNAWVFAAVERR